MLEQRVLAYNGSGGGGGSGGRGHSSSSGSSNGTSSSNGSSGGNSMATAVVRHHNLYGLGDAELVPAVARLARERRAQLAGAGDNVVDFSYGGNVAHGVLLAAAALTAAPEGGPKRVAGRVVTVTDGEPLPYRQFVEEVLAGKIRDTQLLFKYWSCFF